MPKSKDSFRKLVMDLAKAKDFHWSVGGGCDCGEFSRLRNRAKALRSASRKRVKR